MAPVALILFNRPDKTARVFAEIRKARPRQLFLIADGPRTEDERALTEAARAVVAQIDWECAVQRNYSETNLGCKNRCVSGITWVFEHTDRAIILEDDCLPHPDFFPYCALLLERYKDEPRVMHISGDNFQQKNARFHPTASYYFSALPHIWGWATWKRAWTQYDPDIKDWPTPEAQTLLESALHDAAALDRWNYLFKQYYEHTIDGWDAQWVFACLTNAGMCINPAVNLVTNIGFGMAATHGEKDPANEFGNLPILPLPLPLTHPTTLAIDDATDAYTERYVFEVNRYWRQRIRWFAKRHFPKTYARLRSRLTP